MGQFATHMTVQNGTKLQASVYAHTHCTEKNVNSTSSLTVNGGSSSLVTLTRAHPGAHHIVDWTVQLSNGTHAIFRTNLAEKNVNSSMYIGLDQILIDGSSIARVVPGAGTAPKAPTFDPAVAFKNRAEVPPTMLPKGRVIQLQNIASGAFVAIGPKGEQHVNGQAQGPYTRFIINPSKDGFLRLESQAVPGRFLALKKDLSSGDGGPYTNIKICSTAPNRYVVRSADDRMGLGVEPKRPECIRISDTVGGHDPACFRIHFADVSPYTPPPPAAHQPPPPAHHNVPPPAHHHVPPPAHHVPPPAAHHQPPPPAHHQPPPPAHHNVPPPAHHHVPPPAKSIAPTPAHHNVPPPAHHHVPPPAHHQPPPPAQAAAPPNPTAILTPGRKVHLTNAMTGKNARLYGGKITGDGGNGVAATFVVNPSPNGYLRFESFGTKGSFLTHNNGAVGSGGPHCEFVALPTGVPNQFYFRSPDSKRALGFNADASVATDAHKVETGNRGRFTIFFAQ